MNNPQPLMQNKQETKVIGVIEDYARETSTSEIGVWTDGVGLFYDNAPLAEFTLDEGVKYRITIEEIL